MTPKTIRRGSFQARIYQVPTRSRGKVYQRYEVRWTDFGGKQHRVKRSALRAAEALAVAKAEDLASGKEEANRQPADLESYDQGVIHLGKTGIRFAEAGRMLAAWWDQVTIKVGKRPSQLEFEAFTTRAIERMAGQNHVGRKTTKDALVEFLAEKRRRKLISPRHREDLQERITVFANAFSEPLCDLQAEPVERWLRTLVKTNPDGKVTPLSNRTQNNYLGALKNFFTWAHGAGLVEEEFHRKIQAVDFARTEEVPTEIFTPDELDRLLTAAPKEFEAAIAIGAFAGLRSSEIIRLDWKEVKAERGVIEVTAGKAKTAMRRLVPISPNLGRWLAAAPAAGPVWRHSRAYFHELQRQTAAKSLLSWKHNALRHSFISYRLALVHDINQVAAESGNSARMIQRHYRELVTPDDARRWFGLNPAPGAKVVQGVFQAFAAAK